MMVAVTAAFRWPGKDALLIGAMNWGPFASLENSLGSSVSGSTANFQFRKKFSHSKTSNTLKGTSIKCVYTNIKKKKPERRNKKQ